MRVDSGLRLVVVDGMCPVTFVETKRGHIPLL